MSLPKDTVPDPHADPLVASAMRAAAAGQAAGCPDADLLGLYAEQALSGDAHTRLESHVQGCGRCQAIVAALVQDAARVVRRAARRPTRRRWGHGRVHRLVRRLALARAGHVADRRGAHGRVDRARTGRRGGRIGADGPRTARANHRRRIRRAGRAREMPRGAGPVRAIRCSRERAMRRLTSAPRWRRQPGRTGHARADPGGDALGTTVRAGTHVNLPIARTGGRTGCSAGRPKRPPEAAAPRPARRRVGAPTAERVRTAPQALPSLTAREAAAENEVPHDLTESRSRCLHRRRPRVAPSAASAPADAASTFRSGVAAPSLARLRRCRRADRATTARRGSVCRRRPVSASSPWRRRARRLLGDRRRRGPADDRRRHLDAHGCAPQPRRYRASRPRRPWPPPSPPRQGGASVTTMAAPAGRRCPESGPDAPGHQRVSRPARKNRPVHRSPCRPERRTTAGFCHKGDAP